MVERDQKGTANISIDHLLFNDKKWKKIRKYNDTKFTKQNEPRMATHINLTFNQRETLAKSDVNHIMAGARCDCLSPNFNFRFN